MNKPESLANSRLAANPNLFLGLQPRYAERCDELETKLNLVISKAGLAFPFSTVVGLTASGGGDSTMFAGFLSFGQGTAPLPAQGSVVVGGGGGVVEGMTFILDDGINPPVTFEFDSNGSVIPTPTLRPVVYNVGDTDAQVAAAVVAAVNGAPLLAITAGTPFGGGPTTVPLVNDNAGTIGNQAIVTAGFAPPFATTGMGGGANFIFDAPHEIPTLFARVFCEESAQSDSALAKAASRLWNRITAAGGGSLIYDVQIAVGGSAPKYMLMALVFVQPIT